ncbi:MAG: phosphoribosylformimino-5-aminoimidazole carboxamide ribotide isomerase [Candidatus Gastranaerophilales bacterium]|nr:phosphoribosylformimino-5-aminoimidazole carboxamide ribotide isomerase [Candidatus Gastranaerophilales bacterium]
MEFRPCIDIHNGKVKQIVGGSLRDQGDRAKENFVAEQDAAFFARIYRDAGLKGGHVILLNSADSEYFAETKKQALEALGAYPDGLQVGGGVTKENAAEYLDAGASHVIVTSYVFRDGRIHFDRLRELVQTVGKNRLVLDVSCKKKKDGYIVMTDRWQKETKEALDRALLAELAKYCDEFLIHAVDVEGKAEGIERDLVKFLGANCACPVTYAGGVHSLEDLKQIRELGRGLVNVTVGSALDLFGGILKWEDVLAECQK